VGARRPSFVASDIDSGNATGVAASTWCAGPSVYGGPAKGSAAIQGNACFWNIDQAMFTIPND